MDEDCKDGDFFSPFYCALDRLEALDPNTRHAPWFKLLKKTANKALAPHLEKAHKPPTQHQPRSAIASDYVKTWISHNSADQQCIRCFEGLSQRSRTRLVEFVPRTSESDKLVLGHTRAPEPA